MKYNFDCVVVGAGIAGMTAAIYLKRANTNVLILDNDAPGGLLNKIDKIENYPGYLSITGPELAYKVYEQVQNLNIEIRYGKVLEIDNHIIKTDMDTISASKIIIATGRQAKKLKDTNDIKNISYCTVCDANMYKDKTVALIGNDSNAVKEAIYLNEICKEVILIYKCNIEKDLINSLKNEEGIKILENSTINTLEKKDNKIISINTNYGNYNIDGLFVSLGYEPNVNFLKNLTTENGYIVVNDKMQTNIDYIYACGDIIKKDVYQLTTAVGEATKAAINVKKSLN